MNRNWRNGVLAAGVVLAPVFVLANSGGAPAGSSGVPGEQTCSRSGCHLNASVGSQMTITAASGTTYTPGVRQTLTVTITDQNNRYGFQITARNAENARTQAGAFTGSSSVDAYCLSADLTIEIPKPASGCPANRPLEYATHGSATSANRFTVDWTPPATAVGDIILYAAGNAANGNGSTSGDRIHTTTLRLTPAASQTRPSISEGGVIQASAFGGGRTISPGTWIEIFGANLAAAAQEWAGGDFNGSTAPTTIGGVSVTIGNQPAFVRFIGPNQVNVQVPNVGVGPTVMTVRNANGTSDNFNVTVAAQTPGWLAPANFLSGGRQYIAALYPESNAGGPFVGRPNLIAGIPFRSARPGDRIILYGIGFGATTPSVAPGQITTVANSINGFSLRFGDATVATEYAGLGPNFVGLYQINAVVPNLPPGEYEIRGTANGIQLPSGIFINLQ